MFHLLAKATEFLAPNLKPEEELFLQWHNLVKELKRRNGTQISVEETDVPLRLQWIFNLMQQDSPITSGNDPGIGACLEFALRYKIFDWLVALGREDKPTGLKSYVLFFITNFVGAPSTAPLLSKSFLYKPLARLVGYCGNSRCSPWDREEMAFLQNVVDVVEKDPCLANLFLKSNLQDPAERLDVDLKSLVLPQNLFLGDQKNAESFKENDTFSSKADGVSLVSDRFIPENSHSEKENFSFPLLDSLLRMALNPAPFISTQARQAVLTVLRTRESVVNQTISKSNSLNKILIKNLRKFYFSIPKNFEKNDFFLQNETGDFEPLVRSFTQWIVFIDQIFSVSDENVKESLKNALKKEFIFGGFFSDSTSASSVDSLIDPTDLIGSISSKSAPLVDSLIGRDGSAVNLLIDSSSLASAPLVDSFIGWSDDWLGNVPERNKVALAVMIRMYKTADSVAFLSVLSEILLENRIFSKFLFFMSSSQIDFTLLAFDLLDVMIQKPTFYFVEEAFLRYLESRMYIRKEQRMQDTKWSTSELAEAADRAAMFRDLFPTVAKSCTVMEEEKDCESYVRESHYSMTRITQRCKDLDWPPLGPLKSCNVLLAEESSFFDGQAFNEGPLLRVLFSLLNNMLSQSYVLNLRVTGLLSKICLIPHPALREYLLDPTVPLSSQCSSLYRCLVSLVQKMDVNSRQIKDFKEKLVLMRKFIRNGQWSEKCVDAESVFLCGVVTLEEFCKEIAARASVRFSSVQ